ncbi:hypothetical protein GPA05_15310 [Bacillus toyonensis]|uniref:Uncharacterized protein n=1 Tax=Bacillus toyonensis TaxID=155322 RepID=A0ABX6GEA1_9BACI|nr:hypothetical protein GPA05_15310 [Bacillus toyonensis]
MLDTFIVRSLLDPASTLILGWFKFCSGEI